MKNEVKFSRLVVYALSRCLDNTPLSDDAGTTVRSACRVIKNFGICKESIYPYNTSFVYNLPPLHIFKNSYQLQNFSYMFIEQNILSIKQALIDYNSVIVFSIMVYSSFMSDIVSSTGIVPMPNLEVDTPEGGHCICLIGYTQSHFICVNSWGTSWGDKGKFYLPYLYINDPILSGDFCLVNFKY
jgi:C1A family cysteine protease